jgi:aspartate/tyrosine/aromatic aminotransferase
VYLVGSSRINLAGLNQRNIAYVAKAIAAVL